MGDINPSINLNIDTSNALSALKALQAQISSFHQQLRSSGASANTAISDNLTKNLVNSINATNKFSASLSTVKTTTESFTDALDRNKLSLGQYFKYGMANTKSFSKVFQNEFKTLDKVARERTKTIQTQYIKLGRDANGALQAIKVRPLVLDMNDLGTQVSMAAQKQAIFNQIVKQGSTALLNFGKNTQWAGRQLMVGLTIPLSIFGSTASKAFMELEKEVIKFKRVYGELNTSAQETDAMAESIKKLAGEFTKYGVAIKDTMALAAEAAAMGKMGADLTAQVAEATRLSVLGGVDQAKALETTISVTNAFGIAADQLAGKIDFLNAVENQTVTAIEDLTIAIPKAGPVVKQLGGSVEDLAFFLTAMKEGGINASEGANALKSGLASMINPTKKVTDMLSGFGININAIVEGNAGNLKQTIIDFGSALDTLDPLNRARAIEQMFGKFQFARISTLLENVSKDGSQTARVLQLANASAQELAVLSERELKRVEDSPMYKFQKAIEDIKNDLVPIGQQFLEMITPIIKFVGDMLKQFNSMDKGIKDFVAGAVVVLGAIAPVALMTFGLFANGIANLIKGFNAVRGLFSRVAGAGTGLTQATQYLTLAELEASAASASLGQQHTALTAIFSSETAAVNALATAYRAAISAQAGIGAEQVISRVSPTINKTGRRRVTAPQQQVPGFASGVFNLPGPKGAGDILPAMLSPGESVISAPLTKKYGGFIQAIIADNVPGFKNSKIPNRFQGYDDKTFRTQANATGFQDAAINAKAGVRPDVAVVSASDFAADIEAKGASYFAPTIANMVLDTVGPNGDVAKELQNPAYRAWGDSILSMVLDELNKIGDSPIAESKVQEIVRNAGVKAGEPLGIAGNVAKTFDTPTSFQDDQRLRMTGVGSANGAKPAAGKRAQVGAGQRKYDATIIKSTALDWVKQNIGEAAAAQRAQDLASGKDILGHIGPSKNMTMSEMESALIKSGVAPTQHFARTRDLLKSGNMAIQMGPNPLTGNQMDDIIAPISDVREKGAATLYRERLAAQGLTEADIRGSRDAKNAGRNTGGNYAKAGTEAADTVITQAKKDLEIRSPSRRASREIGTPIAQGIADGIERGAPEVQKAMHDATTPSKKSRRAYGKTLPDGTRIVGSGVNPDLVPPPMPPAQELVPEPTQKEKLSIASRFKGMFKKASVAKPGSNELAFDQDGNPIVDKKGNHLTKDQHEESLMKMKKAQERSSKAGKAFGILGTATMIAGMASTVDGPIGAIAQQAMPILGSLSAIAPMLMSLPGPIALVVAGLGLMAFGVFKLNEHFKQIRENASKMAKSLGVGREAIDKYAEAAGTATASQIMDKRREDQSTLYAIQPGKSEFGDKFVESEAGQQLKEQLDKAVESYGKGTSVKLLANQLTTAIASGAITADQAASIATSLGKELKDYNFASQVILSVSQLLGPDGTDLTKNPLRITTVLVQQQQERVTGDTGILTQLDAEAQIYKGLPWLFDKQIELEARSAVAIQDQVSQAQQLLDVLDNQYITRIDNLRASGKLAEADALNAEWQDARSKQQQQNSESLLATAKALNDLGSGFGGGVFGIGQSGAAGDQVVENLQQAANKVYEGNDLAKKTIERIADAENIARGSRALILANVANGTIGDQTLQYFQETFDPKNNSNSKTYEILANISASVGGAGAAQLMQVLDMFGTGTGSKEKKIKLIADIGAMDPAKAQDVINTLTTLSNYEGIIDQQKLADLFASNTDALNEFAGKLKQLKDLKDSGKLDITSIIEQKIITDQSQIDALKGNQKYFDSLDPIQRVLYVQTFIAAMGTIDDAQAKSYIASKYGGAGTTVLDKMMADPTELAKARAAIASQIATSVTTAANMAAGSATTTSNNSSGGGGTDPFADILTKLKQVRNAAVNAAGGLKELSKWYGKGFEKFNGMSQQLTKMGFADDFVSYITNLDDATRKKFASISNGVIKLTDAGKKMQKAFEDVTLGAFQQTQVRTITDIKNQETALQKLTDAGLAAADAYELIADAALAAAIASKNLTKKELAEIVAVLKEAKKLSADFQMKEAVTSAFEKRKAEYMLSSGKGSFLQKQGILSDEQLIKEFVQAGSIDKMGQVYKDRLAQIIGDPKFILDAFNGGYNDAMSMFANQENKIKLAYSLGETVGDINVGKINTTKEQQTVNEQSAKISKLNYDIDDYNASLTRMQKEEDAINKKYDERQSAMDKIAKVNDKLISQQKSQLSIAQALASGDVAAAAEAQAQLQAQQAQDQADKQQEMLDAARKKELESLTQGGLTRLQIEQNIKDLQEQIFNIEEDFLEPAQRRLEIANEEITLANSKLTVLEKTREEWEKINMQMETARLSDPSVMAGVTFAGAASTLTSLKDAIAALDKMPVTPASLVEAVKAAVEPATNNNSSSSNNNNSSSSSSSSKDTSSTSSTSSATKSATMSDTQAKAIATAIAATAPKIIDQVASKAVYDQSGYGSNVAGYIKSVDAGKQTDAFNSAVKAATATASANVAKAAGVVVGKTTADTAAKIISSAVTSPKVVAAVQKTSTTAGEANKFANLASKVVVKSPTPVVAKPAATPAKTTTSYTSIGSASGYQLTGTTAPKKYFAKGGMVPKYFAEGGLFKPRGTDMVPAMLTPGEFVVSKYGVKNFGADRLKAINSGASAGDSVYNYSINVNVKSDASADQIANSVIARIKQIDDRRIRSNRF